MWYSTRFTLQLSLNCHTKIKLCETFNYVVVVKMHFNIWYWYVYFYTVHVVQWFCFHLPLYRETWEGSYWEGVVVERGVLFREVCCWEDWEEEVVGRRSFCRGAFFMKFLKQYGCLWRFTVYEFLWKFFLWDDIINNRLIQALTKRFKASLQIRRWTCV